MAGGGRDSVNARAPESDPEGDVQSPERTVPPPVTLTTKANLTVSARADSIRNQF